MAPFKTRWLAARALVLAGRTVGCEVEGCGVERFRVDALRREKPTDAWVGGGCACAEVRLSVRPTIHRAPLLRVSLRTLIVV